MHHKLPRIPSLTIFLTATLLQPPTWFTRAQTLSDDQIYVVSARFAEGAQQSWELGTRSQAILELNATTYSVFSSTSLPPPSTIPSSLTGPLEPFFAIARTTVTNRSISNGNETGPQPLMADGAAGDPASIGMSVLIANWTGQDKGTVDYAGAAKDQLDYLFDDVPKTADGAISHRVNEVQLWSDFVYMVPPFLAYYGVTSRNRTLLGEAYNQIRLYRNYLLDPQQHMWKHIVLGTDTTDPGFWSTGNGWAVAGMLRVLATIRQSEYANTLKSEQNDLASWIREVHSGIYANLDSTHIFTNYADQPATAPNNFYDASSTALLASTVYRSAVLNKEYTYLPFAEKSRQALSSLSPNASSSSSLASASASSASASASAASASASSSSPSSTATAFSNYLHFTSDGWLTPVVDPYDYPQQGSDSPEGQAFVVEMQAAWRDWVAAGSKGANGAGSVRLGGGWGGVMVGLVVGVWGVI